MDQVNFLLMRDKSQPKWKYYFSCHFIAVSAWLIMKSNYKKIPKEYRIEGICVGGGLEIAACCDIRICGKS